VKPKGFLFSRTHTSPTASLRRKIRREGSSFRAARGKCLHKKKETGRNTNGRWFKA
jgi:hypothetical protein